MLFKNYKMTYQEQNEYQCKVRDIKNKNKLRRHEPHLPKNNVLRQNIFRTNKKSRQSVKNFKRNNSISRDVYM